MLCSLTAMAIVRVLVDNEYKKMSALQKLIKFFIAFVCGALTGLILYKYGMIKTSIWAGPLATLSGESFIKWLTTHYGSIYDTAYSFVQNFVKKKNNTS